MVNFLQKLINFKFLMDQIFIKFCGLKMKIQFYIKLRKVKYLKEVKYIL